MVQDSRWTRRIYLLFTFSAFIKVSFCDHHGQDDKTGGNGHLPMLTNEEMNELIKDRLDEHPRRSESQGFEMDFQDLFESLNSMANRMPDDFEFDPASYPLPMGHLAHSRASAMKCLNNANQFMHFLHHIRAAMHELHEEYAEDLTDSMEDDGDTGSHDNDTSVDHDLDDAGQNSAGDTGEVDLTTDTLHAGQDHPDHTDDLMDTTGHPDDNTSKETDRDISLRKRRDTGNEAFHLDELLDRLESDDIECLAGFVSEGDEKFLCRRFARRSSSIFAKIMAAGSDCEDYLLEDTDHDHDLDEYHQLAILKRFMDRESAEMDEDDIRKVLMLAPDVIDDVFLEDLPEELFRKNMHILGRLAAKRGGNPRLRYALREKLDDLDLSSFTVGDIEEIGTGLLSLRLDQIETLNGNLLLDSHIVNFFDTHDSHMDSSEVFDDDEEDDDDDHEDVRLAVGRRVKEAIRQSGLQKHQIGRAMRYLHYDLDFVRSIEPDDLLDTLEDFKDLDFDDSEARSVIFRLTQSARFPPPEQLTSHNLTHMGRLLRGMGVDKLRRLNREALEDALDDIKDVEFDEFQAHEILNRLNLVSDDAPVNLGAHDVRRLGKLIRGVPASHMMEMRDDVIEEALDDLNDVDLDDAQKRIIAEKVRHGNGYSWKLLELDNFADALSIDDIDEFDDDQIKMHINVSSRMSWRLPQAAALAVKYKRANGVPRLRPSDLAVMGKVARGLLPEDLDDMAKTQDDVFDLAEELIDMHEDITSGQIDEMVDSFNDVSDLDNKDVVIDEAEAMQGAHVLAYLKQDHFGKLEFTAAGKRAFVSQVAKMSSHKMARSHAQFLARKLLDMIEDMDSTETQDELPEDRESRRLRSLGQMALGLTPSQIKGFSGKAIIDNLDILRTLPLTETQSRAVLEKVESGLNDWRCRSDVLARVGPLLQHHDNPFSDDCGFSYQEELLSSFSAVMEGMKKRREMVKERLEEGFARENDDATDEAGEKRLVDAMVVVATQKTNVRKRRATISTDGSLTCDVLSHVGSSSYLVDAQLFASMPADEFVSCLPMMGAISDWSQEMLDTLSKKAKAIFSDISNWPRETIVAAGSIIAGLSPAEIKQLSGLKGVDVMYSIGRHGRLSTEQLKAGFRRWMEVNGKKGVHELLGGEFAALSEFVCGLETAEIGKINATTFRHALDVIGHSISCTHEQRLAYVAKAQSVYGSQISQWTPAIVADMGHLLGALRREQVKMLTAQQLSFVLPTVIQHMPSEAIAAMAPGQLGAFSTNQANAVTQAQYDTLTPEQKEALNSRINIKFTTEDTSSTGGETAGPDEHDDAAAMTFSTVLILTSTLLVFMMM